MTEREALSELRERAVRAELQRLLESTAFRTSRRCRDFLSYIVEHTMSGQRLTLKERSIGIDLFQLPYDFDTGQRTIVRVTASEVRKKLAQHYLADNGTHHAVRIDLTSRFKIYSFDSIEPARAYRTKPTEERKRCGNILKRRVKPYRSGNGGPTHTSDLGSNRERPSSVAESV
jgi:hypothetical protein